MNSDLRRTITIAIVALTAFSAAAEAAQSRRSKRQKQPESSAPVSAPADRRDRVVNAPGTPFNGRAYWQASAQCGGVYFKLGAIHSEAAVRAKVLKPDPAAYAEFTKKAATANRAATMFFEAAEHFLIADRKLTREDAVLTYDPIASANGDRVKTAEAAVTAAAPCAEFYVACHGAFPQLCNERGLPTE